MLVWFDAGFCVWCYGFLLMDDGWWFAICALFYLIVVLARWLSLFILWEISAIMSGLIAVYLLLGLI